MTEIERCVSSAHIQKLGHSLQEIRERALRNIASKFEHGFTYDDDNDLARSKEILQKLFEWFLFEECSHEEVVLKLIKRILQTESGLTLLKHYGPKAIAAELKQIKACVEAKHHPIVEDILEFVRKECGTSRTVVPPLQSDVPLSYRSHESNRPRTIESTASPIEGFIRGDSSLEQQMGVPDKSERASSLGDLPYRILRWQSLVTPDQHVLQSVEDSLRNPPQPSALLHSCEFFTDIMIQDFPAEVFPQRPGIVLIFQRLITSSASTRVSACVLKCLLKLTGLLKTRLNYYSDPATHNLKHVVKVRAAYSGFSSPASEGRQVYNSEGGRSESPEDSSLLQARQISLPYYCLSTMKCVLDYLHVKPERLGEDTAKKKYAVGVNTSLSLLTSLIDLLTACVTETQRIARTEFADAFNDVLIKFGEVIENFRLEVLSNDYEKTLRIVHLHLLGSCARFLRRFISPGESNVLLPRNLKSALSFAVLDLSFAQLYPRVHEDVLVFVQEFDGHYKGDSMSRYNIIKDVCTGMTSSVRLLKNHKSLSVFECVTLMKESLNSLEFHKNLTLLKIFVDLCANKLPMHSFKDDVLNTVEEITLRLLAHNDPEVRLQMYKLCYKKVIAAIGPKLNTSRTGAPGSQILFLTRSEVLIEIALHGMAGGGIIEEAEDILIHVLKCKILVSDEIWNAIVEALIPALPLLLSYADGKSVLGRTVVSMLDPDRATSLNLGALEVLKGNVLLLFNNDPLIREEGVSRLSWMLASEYGARELLPRLNNLHDRALSTVCRIEHVFDLNKVRSPQQFYQPSSLYQVLQLLGADNVEPVIRRSALTQIAVMMEDPLVHATFIQNKGVPVVIGMMKSALNEACYTDYPDSVMPCVSILKNVCLYNLGIRHELSTNAEVFYFTVRGLFLFCTEARMKQDASTLLFLLLLNNFVMGTPSKGDLAIPKLISERLCVPFSCKTHPDVRRSKHAPLSQKTSLLLEDKWSFGSLQIHWNAEWFGGFNELLKWDKVDYAGEAFSEMLRMSEAQLRMIKQTSLEFCVNKYLGDLRNVTSGQCHQSAVDLINKLTECLQLYVVVKDECGELLDFPWKESFARFLDVPPSSESDAELLGCVLHFLDTLLLFYKYADDCWIVDLLKEKTNPLLEILRVDLSHDVEIKALNKELLQLIANSASYEQHYLDWNSSNRRSSSSWSHVVEIIAENLKVSDAQHFYNLAYLDCLLSCLVHLTATLGWSRSKNGASPKPMLLHLVMGLCEMIDAFHSSKGPSAADSLMGLSITRHAVLILNHVLVEMQHFNVKAWDSCFLKEESGLEDSLSNLCALCVSRDVVLRAAVYQLLSGLAVSNRCATELVQELKDKGGGFWQNCLSVLMECEEASIVKENVANLLANVCSHTVAMVNGSSMLDASVAPTNVHFQSNTPEQAVLKLLDDVSFYKELETILSCLYPSGTFLAGETFNRQNSKNLQQTGTAVQNNSLIDGEYVYAYINGQDHPTTRTDISDNHSLVVLTTPSYIKALTSFIFNLLLLAPSEISFRLQEHDLIKSFFKCLCVPEPELRNTRDLALYCDILEMNAGICSVLTEATNAQAACLGVILHARDCLNVLFALLNPSIYQTTLPQLVYLRNKLWSEIFTFIASVLNHTSAFAVVSSVLSECGNVSFLQALQEAITSKNSDDLQQSALSSLTSLLLHKQTSSEEDKTMQDLLDKTRTPRTSCVEENARSSRSSDTRNNLGWRSESDEDLMAGATLCKILLHLLEVTSVKHGAQHHNNKKKSLVINTLTSVLCVSHEAKKYALDEGLLATIVQQLREFHLKLSLDSVEALRRVSDRKRLGPVLKEIGSLLGLLTNFMFEESTVKSSAARLGFADVLHKLWAWLLTQKELLVVALKLLCTYTTDCLLACQSLPLTSSVAGAGPRKAPSNMSLLHAVINLITKEMDQISRTHDMLVLQLCFHLLENSCNSVECRIILSKANLFHCLTRLHPAITKKQKPWECVELIWLEFLQAFTSHPEGQACVAKISDVLDLVIILTNSTRLANRQAAMMVLRNVSFYQCNRPRLLTSAEFLNTLEGKLASGSLEEKNLVVTIMWSLAANNQRAKLVFKCAGLDRKLQETLKILHLTADVNINRDDLDRMHYVLNLLKDNKCK